METEGDVSATSLDAVGLNSPPTSRRHCGSGVVVSCSVSNLDSKINKHNEVVVKADDTEEGLNEPLTKTCHICDINVLEVHYKEHKSGYRHKFNRKVADAALKRQLCAETECINENNEKLSSKYFCAECLIVNNEDETSHVQTTAHQNSVLLERFLKGFQKCYPKDDNDVVDNVGNDVITERAEESKSPKQENFSDEPNTDIYEYALVEPNTEETSGEQKSIAKKSVTKEKIEIRKEDVIKRISDNIYASILASLGQLGCFNYSSTDLNETETYLKFYGVSPNNQFKVVKYFLESIVEIDAVLDCCMACDETFARENRSTHVKSKQHYFSIYLKPLNLNCIRQINSSDYNCVLCNAYFGTVHTHVNSEKHLRNYEYRNKLIGKRVKEAEDDNNEEKEYDNSKKHSDVLEDESKNLSDANTNTGPVNKKPIIILTSSFLCLYSYICPSVDIQSNILCDTCNEWASIEEIRKHRRGTKHVFNTMSEYHYLLQYLDEDNLVCNICKVTVSNAQEDIVDHCTQSKHVKKCSKILKSENMSKVDDNIYYCAKCKEYILHKNEYLHIESKKHSGPKEEIDKVEFHETVVTDKGNGGTDRSDDPANVGDTNESAALDDNTGGVGSGNATDNVEASTHYNFFVFVTKQLTGFSKIDAYKFLDKFHYESIFKVGSNKESVDELRMIKSLIKHLISLRGQKD